MSGTAQRRERQVRDRVRIPAENRMPCGSRTTVMDTMHAITTDGGR